VGISDNKNDKTVKKVLTIQIVRYCCSNCTEEEDVVKVCPNCGETMRVIEVIEKYGDEAEDYLKKIASNQKDEKEWEDGLDELDVKHVDIDADDEENISDEELLIVQGSIFSSSGDTDVEKKSTSSNNSLGDILDQDEDGVDLEEFDFGEDDFPSL